MQHISISVLKRNTTTTNDNKDDDNKQFSSSPKQNQPLLEDDINYINFVCVG